MKKVLSAVLAASMVASLAACGSSSTPEATTAAAAAGDTTTAAAAEGTTTAAGSSDLTWKIGAQGPLTGGAAIYGKAVINGAQVAIDEINANGGESIAVVADVAQRDTWVQLKKLADEKYGRIDTVVNGAAAFSPPTHDWAHITSEMIEDVMRVNIDSMLYSYQTVLRYMMKKKIRGSFLNFSSSTALAYNGSAVQGYPFSKACIKLATQNMVNQVSKKYGIRFNCLAPNYVWVPKQEKVWDMYREHFEATTPMPYVGMPEDAAWAVVYLCSDEAKYINGVCLPVDGGWAVQK